jgi:hypothetical protein
MAHLLLFWFVLQLLKMVYPTLQIKKCHCFFFYKIGEEEGRAGPA